MKKNKKAFSIIEAMVVLAILSLGMVGVYSLLHKSKNFLEGVSAKIEAIEIAREGVEALENIRNTNWLRFSSNFSNCWDALNYDSKCILDNSSAKKIGGPKNNPKKYILKNNSGVWNLEEKNISGGFKDVNYRQNFSVGKDKITGQYCQPVDVMNCITKGSDGKVIIGNYIRKIEVENIGYKTLDSSKNTKIKVTVTVEWTDPSVNGVRKIELLNLMTNYKE